MTNPATPGARIRALRKDRHKLTAADVAAAVGVSRAHLSMIETGQDLPGRETLAAIADYFGVSVDYILHGGTAAAQPPRSCEIVDDPDELALLRFWRSLTTNEQSLMLKMLGAPPIA